MLRLAILTASFLICVEARAQLPLPPPPPFPRLEPGPFVIEMRQFLIPIGVSDEGRKQIKSLRLFVSTDKGRTWELAKEVDADARTFPFKAERDGEHWFIVQSILLSGKALPENVAKQPPDLRVLVGKKPEPRKPARAAYPEPVEDDYLIKDFKLASGETLAELRMHYRTLGKPQRDKEGKVRNAVLILHATGGKGDQFVGKGKADDWFAGEVFGLGQPLDAERYFIIIPDNLGHGKSTKPSDGLGGRFPKYGYHDMIEAQHRLVTEGLKVDHLRLVLGTSMGGMHTWLWGQKHPDFMDALVPLASLPVQISGRNRMWRKTISELIRGDPEWKEGDYKTPPRSLRTAAQMMYLMSGNPLMRQKEAPTAKEADEVMAKEIAKRMKNLDANDLLYAIESSFDYDPRPGLDRIRAPLLAINFADDLINPPELGILEREIKGVKLGRAIVIAQDDDTVGHSTHTKAAIWKEHLERLLKDTER